MKIFKKPKRIILLLSAVFYGFSVSFISLAGSTQKVYAADMDPKIEAIVYQSMRFLMQCSRDHGWRTANYFAGGVTERGLDNGVWFNDPRAADDTPLGSPIPSFSPTAPDTKNVGYLLSPDSGTLSCFSSNNVKTALEKLGIDSGANFLIEAGIYEAPSSGTNFSLKLENNEARAQAIKRLVQEKFPDAALQGEMSGAAKYFNLLASFRPHCAPGNPISSGGSQVSIVDEATGDNSPANFIVSGSEKFVGFGYGNLDGGGGSNANQEMRCSTIVTGLNAYAGDAERRVKAILDAGGSVSGSATVDSGPSCTQRAALSFGWAVCGLLEFIASGIEGLMSTVDGLLNVDALKLQDDENLRTVWSYFRVISTFALLAIGLVMVISQAIGGNS